MNKYEGSIYFLTTKSKKAIKIGYTRSKDINKRIKQLSTGNSEELILLYFIEGSMAVEKHLHIYFGKEYQIKNEWYDYKKVYEWIERHKLEKEVLKQLGYIK